MGATIAIGPTDNLSGDTADGCLACGAIAGRQAGDGVRVCVELVVPPSRIRPTVDPLAIFRRDGAIWTLAFADVAVQITHQKGLLDLRHLLARPGTEVHCLDLANRPADTGGDAPVLDDRARREIGARIRNLQQEIERASAAHDTGQTERAREELDQLVEHLSGALGLRGRARPLGSAAERARSTVTWRIRSAMKRIAAVHPRLGRHLENAVRTGTFCGYEPETPTIWTL